MKGLRIYLDTSVVNFVFADDSPDFQRVTIEFFENHAARHDLYVSKAVLFEIDQDPQPDHRTQLRSILAAHSVGVLPDDEDEEILRLALCYMEKGAIPKNKMQDARHVAYATFYEMDVLLSWNFKHLANVAREARIHAVNIEEGYRYPLRLASPLEVVYE